MLDASRRLSKSASIVQLKTLSKFVRFARGKVSINCDKNVPNDIPRDSAHATLSSIGVASSTNRDGIRLIKALPYKPIYRGILSGEAVGQVLALSKIALLFSALYTVGYVEQGLDRCH